MKWLFFLFLISCGSTKKNYSTSVDESFLHMRLNQETTDPDLLALIQEGADTVASEIIIVTKLDDVDALAAESEEISLLLSDSKKKKKAAKKKAAKKKQKKKVAKKKKAAKKKQGQASTCLALADSCDVGSTLKKQKKQKDLDGQVKDQAKLPAGKKVFRGARIQSRSEIQKKMLNGFDADPVGFDEKGKLKHKSKSNKDKNVYVTGRLSVQSAVADASFDQGEFVKGGGKVVFSFTTKDDQQGVDVDKNTSESRKTKQAALRGRVSPDQILGYWDVTDAGDIGEFHENPYQSKTTRATTRIGSAFSNFFSKVSDALKSDDNDENTPSQRREYDPAIPGTTVPVSRTKIE